MLEKIICLLGLAVCGITLLGASVFLAGCLLSVYYLITIC